MLIKSRFHQTRGLSLVLSRTACQPGNKYMDCAICAKNPGSLGSVLAEIYQGNVLESTLR